ncbi:MAG: ribosomal protein S18-alanine N-acetyltransferase [Deltaproteobacteria bacterium]|nr:ribosomal protein S18-alanine N-acetyltransferase [Deltaproteobacteria bacterium]
MDPAIEPEDFQASAPGKVRAVSVRRGSLHDLDGICEIEHACFAAPWPREVLAEEIAERSWSRVVVASSQNRPVAFMVYWVVSTELHLLNLAVHPRWRRRGLGRMLVDHLLAEARMEGRIEVLLEVRVSNNAAQDLYRRVGFHEIMVRRRYYSDNGEDALVMMLRL